MYNNHFVFLYMSDEHLNTEIKNAISFMALKNKIFKYKSNETVQDFYVENYTMLMKEQKI